MSEIETFFRRCPNCGRRFEVRLLGKKLVSAESIRESMPVDQGFSAGYGGSFLEVSETEPAIVAVEKFQYAYKCKHCGHQWVEIKDKDFREA